MLYIKENNNGLTLIELSIVIVIIGIVVAGITIGQSAIRSALLKSIMIEANGFKVAITAYEDYYRDLPGDHTNAYDFFDGSGGKSICGENTSDKSGCNGDGDKLLHQFNDERQKIWKHLSLAGIYPNNLTGRRTGWDKYVAIGTNTPKSKYKGGWAFDFSSNNFQFSNYIKYGESSDPTGTKDMDIGLLSPADLHSIDTKFDDSNAFSGKIVTDEDGCYTNLSLGPPRTAEYNLANEKRVCILSIYIDSVITY